ncbi:MarR family transcriptional regulator [Sphingorhabdus sp. SMR4y]|uniref:MarR family transcriptional regulator n=1 Tax=Sphingorhabdus sp. SMR4y TaxID=2584094 RepID=UPI0011AB8A3C|nr:helix-turn-helix domain-containing protein [Sphingorhabdus sp. SMR4y]
MTDPALTALDHRVLGVISLHDGMSLVNGKGAGCYASYGTLTKLAGCDYTNFGRSVSKLIKAGYISREPQLMDKRRFTLRVFYPEILDETNNKMVGEINNETDQKSQKVIQIVDETNNEIVGDEKSESVANLPETNGHYIPLNGELNSVETEELDSDESARLKSRQTMAQQRKWNVPVSPPRKHQSTGQVLAMLERDIKGGRSDLDVEDWDRWLTEIIETESRSAVVQQASRIYESFEWELAANRGFQ